MDSLAQQRCLPCEGGTPALTLEEAKKNLAMVRDWEMNDSATEISKSFKFKDFTVALAFTNQIGRIAESEGHHPDIDFGWGRVKVSLTTHAIGGLSENDFILAAKIDRL